MKKKTVIIICSVLAVCILGLFLSRFLSWPVTADRTGGDISKASRFSRGTKVAALTNMEELLQTDEEFKDAIVASQVVMQTRALQFGALVDMSNEVAGDIPAFAGVLEEMNAVRELVENVTNSLVASGANLDAALGGAECADLEQTTINAALAYTTLQKENKLADRFIETTDKYLEAAEGDDRLKFVRDQWVDYQKMTAALEGDEKAAEALAGKGTLLSGEETLACMADFGIADLVVLINSAFMTKYTGVDGALVNALPEGALEDVIVKVRNAAEVYGNQADAMHGQYVDKFNQQVIDALNEAIYVANNRLVVGQQATIAQQATVGQHQTLEMKKGGGPLVFNNTTPMSNVFTIAGYEHLNQVGELVMNHYVRNQPTVSQTYSGGLSNQVNEVIKNTAAGNRATLEFFIPFVE